MSRAGGAPDKRPYSRLYCEGLSYPTRKPAVAASTTLSEGEVAGVLQRTRGGNQLELMMKPRKGRFGCARNPNREGPRSRLAFLLAFATLEPIQETCGFRAFLCGYEKRRE